MRPAPEALRGLLRARVLPEASSPDAQAAALAVRRVGGESVQGVIFFGSRKTRAGYDPWSAYDLFVLTRGYRDFYRSMRAAGALRRRAGLVAFLNAVMPPNQISVHATGPEGAPIRAKCAVITLDRFLRETSPDRSDHFCLGRFFQPAEILYARDDAVRESLVGALASAHALSYLWVRPWLPPAFSVDDYSRTLLRVSLRWEIRPEPGRADTLWDAQREALAPLYSVLLADLAVGGELVDRGSGTYALARPVGFWERSRLRAYFVWSRVRATARWFKYVVTFDDWLDYLVRKVERHSGERIVVTERERRFPLLLLWPKFFRYMRRKRRREAGR